MKTSLLSPKVIIRDILFIGLLIVIDLFTKDIFFNHKRGSEYTLLEPVMNRGISFSMNMSLELVIVMTIFALLLFVYMYIKKIFPTIAIILLLGGTLGNLYDRVVYDGVRDFIVIPNWFICNIADIFLFIGMVVACIYILMEKKKNNIYS